MSVYFHKNKNKSRPAFASKRWRAGRLFIFLPVLGDKRAESAYFNSSHTACA